MTKYEMVVDPFGSIDDDTTLSMGVGRAGSGAKDRTGAHLNVIRPEDFDLTHTSAKAHDYKTFEQWFKTNEMRFDSPATAKKRAEAIRALNATNSAHGMSYYAETARERMTKALDEELVSRVWGSPLKTTGEVNPQAPPRERNWTSIHTTPPTPEEAEATECSMKFPPPPEPGARYQGGVSTYRLSRD